MARSEGSYYREHVSYSPIASTSHHHLDELTYDQDVHQDIHHDSLQDTNHDQGHHLISPIKHCSVRGCTAVLPLGYTLKMCEQCRSRHRTYATTKRAKRKQEKAALGGQTCSSGQVVWMPLDVEDQYHSQNIPSSSHRHDMSVSPEQPRVEIINPHAQPYDYSPWPSPSVDNVDPRLYAANLSSSELAGALTLPPTPPPRDPPEMRLVSEQFAMDLNESYNQSSRSPASSVPTTGEISTKAIEEAAAQLGDPSLPHRYCSIKGCKAVVPGNSFFKMCEPCRNRYRSYGTTKRAKWRKEKEVVVAELQKLRDEEDRRRAENGLPPLPEGDEEWREQIQQLSPLRLARSSFAQAVPSFAPRMCTVSHCREILPGDYEFLRCERHRIQNRHHSKLKRVRDKESKLEACNGWAAVVNKNSPNKDTGASDSEGDYEEDPDMYAKALPEGEPGTGVPPAARGSRRTNHVCSIKVCYNLLSPNNPWKMCDSCRARDRSARRNKALRDSGVPVDPLPPRARSPAKSDAEKKGKKKSKKKTGDVNDEGDATCNDNLGEGSSTEGGTLVFMSPLVMEPSELHADSPHLSTGLADLSFIHADETGNITEPLDVQLVPVPTLIPASQQASTLHANSLTPNSSLSSISRAPVHPNQIKTLSSTKPNPPQNISTVVSSISANLPATNEISASTANSSAVSVTAGVTTSSPVPTASALATAPVPILSTLGPPSVAQNPPSGNTHIQPQFHVPYFVPPFIAAQYPAGPRYSYGNTNPLYRDPYAQPPVFHPPFAAYPAYTYPPPGMYAPPYTLPQTTSAQPGNSAAIPALATAPSKPPSPPASASASSSAPASAPKPALAPSPVPALPPEPAPLYSTFSSRPSGSNNQHLPTPSMNHPSTQASTDTRHTKFIISKNTGHWSPSTDLRRKRLDEPDDFSMTPSKRSDMIEARGAYSSTSSSPGPSITPTTGGEDAQNHGDSSAKICASKNCHKPLPPESPGMICDKCKEKIKKNSAKMKQRFRLEPKKKVAGSSSIR